jgi:hypothetical protein
MVGPAQSEWSGKAAPVLGSTVGSFADHLRGDVRNACSHSSPAVALLNQNELARRTMNVVWGVLRSTSFYFFHYIWRRREYMPALRLQRLSRPPPSPCSRTTQCRTTRTQRHDVHAVRAQSASCGSGQTPRLALYLTGKKETKNYKHLGTELLDNLPLIQCLDRWQLYDSNSLPRLLEPYSRKWLRQDVCKLILSAHKLQTDLPVLDTLSNEMILSFDMLTSIMKHWFLTESNCRLVVHFNHRSSYCQTHQFFQ